MDEKFNKKYSSLINDRNAFRALMHRGSVKIADAYTETNDAIRAMDFCREFTEKYGAESIAVPFSKYFNLTIGCEKDYTKISASFCLTKREENDPHFVLYDDFYDSHEEISEWESRLVETLCWPVFINDGKLRIRDMSDIEDIISFATDENDPRARIKNMIADTADAFVDQLVNGRYMFDYHFVTEEELKGWKSGD